MQARLRPSACAFQPRSTDSRAAQARPRPSGSGEPSPQSPGLAPAPRPSAADARIRRPRNGAARPPRQGAQPNRGQLRPTFERERGCAVRAQRSLPAADREPCVWPAQRQCTRTFHAFAVRAASQPRPCCPQRSGARAGPRRACARRPDRRGQQECGPSRRRRWGTVLNPHSVPVCGRAPHPCGWVRLAARRTR